MLLCSRGGPISSGAPFVKGPLIGKEGVDFPYEEETCPAGREKGSWASKEENHNP